MHNARRSGRSATRSFRASSATTTRTGSGPARPPTSASTEGVEQLLTQMPDEPRAGMLELLDALEQAGFTRVSQRSREQLLRNVALFGPDAAAGVTRSDRHDAVPPLRRARPGDGHEPELEDVRLSRARLARRQQSRRRSSRSSPRATSSTIEADVCIVGSGAGGGVIAGKLARSGLKVVRARGWGLLQRVRLQPARALGLPEHVLARRARTRRADINVSLQAGAGLGGGTVINWTNCLRTTPWVREQWATEHGLEGLDGPEFDRHLDAVFERLSVNDRCSDLNGPQQRMKEGADELGWSFKTIFRNADPDRYDPASAAYMGFGDQSGAKQCDAEDLPAGRRRRRRRGGRALLRRARARRERPRRRRRGAPGPTPRPARRRG